MNKESIRTIEDLQKQVSRLQAYVKDLEVQREKVIHDAQEAEAWLRKGSNEAHK